MKSSGGKPPLFLQGRLWRTVAVLTILCASLTESQTKLRPDSGSRGAVPLSAVDPVAIRTAHSRGNMQLAIGNNGTFGTFGEEFFDPLTQQNVLSCVYPKNSNILYLYVGALWIGAVVGRDTLVSCGSEDFYATDEFWPDVPPFGDFIYKSIDPTSKFFAPDARSEEDIIAEYTDTIRSTGLAGQDQTDGRGHIPLGLKVRQQSMAWSYEYADDFIMFDMEVENIGTKRLRRVYLGLWIDGDVWHVTRRGPIGWEDDIVGFLRTSPAPEGCDFVDTVNIAWTADNDGDPVNDAWDFASPRNAVGVRVVRTPSDSLAYSFNWWITDYNNANFDFGPRQRGTLEEPFRGFGERLGTPTGDRNKYYIMRKPEFDYDLMYTGIADRLEEWLPPNEQADQVADGFDTRYLLSFGPFDIDPSQKLPITFAFAGGTNLHTNTAGIDRFNPDNPGQYYEDLDFSNLAVNARWASWIYDNPGVDTDGDLYRGKYRVCNNVDTFWYEGDGVPDFRGASPPPAPAMRLIASDGQLIVRWNGFLSETTADVFLGAVDFEGYRVYVGRDERASSLSVVQSYDRENFNRYRWVASGGTSTWVLEEIPFTLDSLRRLYGQAFNPTSYTRSSPLRIDTILYYFAAQDFNNSSLSEPGGIRKVYPDAPFPGTDSSLWSPDDLVEGYSRPLPKYYEYEYLLSDLQASVPYVVSVTAFDFGSPIVGLPSLETAPLNNIVTDYPLSGSARVDSLALQAYACPNPYRFDGLYAEQGYENRSGSEASQLSRRIRFANLPKECRISIYSLDGDLIESIDHSFPDGGPLASVAEWNLISRNRQEVVSGLYYFTVEAPGRETQIGKLVILR